MPSFGILDAGPMVAWAMADERRHNTVLALLRRTDLVVIVPALAIAEAAYLVQTRLGAPAEATFIRGLADYRIESPSRPDLLRMDELMRQYADFPLGAADASIVALAERLETDALITFDQRHFRAVRPRHCESFRLLPE
jgi:hypothetical protein